MYAIYTSSSITLTAFAFIRPQHQVAPVESDPSHQVSKGWASGSIGRWPMFRLISFGLTDLISASPRDLSGACSTTFRRCGAQPMIQLPDLKATGKTIALIRDLINNV